MFGDLGKMMKMAGEMKRRLPEMQAKLAATEFSAEAGGGAVEATVNGKLLLTNVKINPTVLAEGHEMVEDLVKAAVSAAQTKAANAAAEAMKEITGGMNLQGLDGLLG